jgi:hypothetical protein
MSNSISNTDLDYLREIAESGQNAPLLGGRFLVWWGALTTLAYAGHYAIAAGIMGGGGSAYGWLWGTYMLLGLGGQFLLVRSMSPAKAGRATSAVDAAMSAAVAIRNMAVSSICCGLRLGVDCRAERLSRGTLGRFNRSLSAVTGHRSLS